MAATEATIEIKPPPTTNLLIEVDLSNNLITRIADTSKGWDYIPDKKEASRLYPLKLTDLDTAKQHFNDIFDYMNKLETNTGLKLNTKLLLAGYKPITDIILTKNRIENFNAMPTNDLTKNDLTKLTKWRKDNQDFLTEHLTLGVKQFDELTTRFYELFPGKGPIEGKEYVDNKKYITDKAKTVNTLISNILQMNLGVLGKQSTQPSSGGGMLNRLFPNNATVNNNKTNYTYPNYPNPLPNSHDMSLNDLAIYDINDVISYQIKIINLQLDPSANHTQLHSHPDYIKDKIDYTKGKIDTLILNDDEMDSITRMENNNNAAYVNGINKIRSKLIEMKDAAQKVKDANETAAKAAKDAAKAAKDAAKAAAEATDAKAAAEKADKRATAEKANKDSVFAQTFDAAANDAEKAANDAEKAANDAEKAANDAEKAAKDAATAAATADTTLVNAARAAADAATGTGAGPNGGARKRRLSRRRPRGSNRKKSLVRNKSKKMRRGKYSRKAK